MNKNNIRLEKAFIADREQVLPMLNKVFGFVNSPNPAFERLFENHWGRNDTEPVGYLIRDDEKVVGFYAYIMYQREIEGTIYDFCNMSTWGVEESYRGMSLQLVKPIKELSQTHTITNFTANAPSHTVFKKLLKFDDIENNLIIIPYLPRISFGHNEILYNNDIVGLNKYDTKIFNDHHPDKYKGIHIYVKHADEYLYIICTKAKRKNNNFLEIRYINNLSLFFKKVSLLRSRLPLKYGVLALIVDKRMIGDETVLLSYNYKLPLSKLYKSSQLNKTQIDGLYSEYFFG
jgi:hypothetical protein